MRGFPRKIQFYPQTKPTLGNLYSSSHTNSLIIQPIKAKYIITYTVNSMSSGHTDFMLNNADKSISAVIPMKEFLERKFSSRNFQLQHLCEGFNNHYTI